METRGVYIQDVDFPADLVAVLTSREIAAQERATFAQQRQAQEARVSLEQQRGVADMQGQLAQANVSIDIERAKAQGATARAEGESAVMRISAEAEAGRTRAMGDAEASRTKAMGEADASRTKAMGSAEASRIQAMGLAEASRTQAVGAAAATAEEALGLARAKGFEAQARAIGADSVALVAALRDVGAHNVKIVPDVQVGGDSGVVGGLAAMLMRTMAAGHASSNGIGSAGAKEATNGAGPDGAATAPAEVGIEK